MVSGPGSTRDGSLPPLDVPSSAPFAVPELEPLPDDGPAPPTHPRAPLEQGVRLSDALRKGTRDVHALAEGTPFADDLLSGRVSVTGYADLLAQYHAVYGTLEWCAQEISADTDGASVVFPELHRLEALENDLTALAGPGWSSRFAVREITGVYAQRVAEVGVSVGGYVAHAYTRYLGDLSGGQVIRSVLQRQHNLDDDAVAYLSFPAITRIKPFKDLYRARIDALPLSPAVQAAVVAEARVAFELNTELLRELGREYCEERGRRSGRHLMHPS